MQDVYMIILSYCLVLVLAFGWLGFIQAGFLIPFLKVKVSRGKKILVRLRKNTSSEFIPAVEKEGLLVFKYNKVVQRISNYKDSIYRSWNINNVDIDGESWGVIAKTGALVSSHNPEKVDSLIERAIYKPSKASNLMLLILVLLIVVLLAVVFVAYKQNYLSEALKGLSTIQGGNI